MMGLLTGTVLGAGLGMLLAPKAGLGSARPGGEQARTFGDQGVGAVQQGSRRRRSSSTRPPRPPGWAETGRDMVNQAREAVDRGAEEARGYAGSTPGSTATTAARPASAIARRQAAPTRPLVSARTRLGTALSRGRVPASPCVHNHDVTPARILLRLRAELRLFGPGRLARPRSSWSTATTSRTRRRSPTTRSCRSFPFLLLVISLLGSVTADDADRLAVLTFVFRYFPTQFDFVDTQLDAFRQTRVQVGVAGGLALIWASLGVFGAITSAVNEAWGVEKQRSFLKHRMVSFLMLVAGGGVMIVGAAAGRAPSRWRRPRGSA